MKTVCIIQARTGSTRLPGKVLLPAPDGRPLLAVMLERVKQAKKLDEIVVATTNAPEDDAIGGVALKAGVTWFTPPSRLDANDVLGRYCSAAESTEADLIVRLTADCPLVDPDLIDLATTAPKEIRYCRTNQRTPWGLDVEAFDFPLLALTHQQATRPSDREHVTHWMRRLASIRRATFGPSQDHGAIRVTVDYREDYDVVSKVLERLGPDCRLPDIARLHKDHPEIWQPNSHISQRVWTKEELGV